MNSEEEYQDMEDYMESCARQGIDGLSNEEIKRNGL